MKKTKQDPRYVYTGKLYLGKTKCVCGKDMVVCLPDAAYCIDPNHNYARSYLIGKGSIVEFDKNRFITL